MSKQRTPLRQAPEPLEANDVATVTIGTVVWFGLFVVQLPFYGWYSDHGHAWWIWTCLAGGGLGLIGLLYVRARRDAIARSATARAETRTGPEGGTGSPGHADHTDHTDHTDQEEQASQEPLESREQTS